MPAHSCWVALLLLRTCSVSAQNTSSSPPVAATVPAGPEEAAAAPSAEPGAPQSPSSALHSHASNFVHYRGRVGLVLGLIHSPWWIVLQCLVSHQMPTLCSSQRSSCEHTLTAGPQLVWSRYSRTCIIELQRAPFTCSFEILSDISVPI